MERKTITSPDAPAAIGAYSPAVRIDGAGGLVFCSGQLGMDPKTGELVEGGVEAQAEQAMANLGALLEASGLGWGSVVRATLYLTDMADFAKVNAVYAKRFPNNPPARVAIGVAALPKGAAFEVDAIAVAAAL